MVVCAVSAVLLSIGAAYLLWHFVYGSRSVVSFVFSLLTSLVISFDLYLAVRILAAYGNKDLLTSLLLPVSSLGCAFLLIPFAIRAGSREPVVPEIFIVAESFLVIAILNSICLSIFGFSSSAYASLCFGALGLLCLIVAVYTPYVSTGRYNAEIRRIDEKINAAQNAQYEAVIQSNFELRRVRHDMKNHLLAIKSMASKSSDPELIDYVDSILGDIDSAAVPYRSGNDIADAIIADKIAKAKKRGLSLKVSGDMAGIKIEANDLVTILANLLDNAIEALCRLYGTDLSSSQKTIKLEFRKNSNFLYIVEKNISGDKIDKGLIRSSKDSPDHGFGVFNIRKVVKKYGGEFDISCESIEGSPLYTVEVQIILSLNSYGNMKFA